MLIKYEFETKENASTVHLHQIQVCRSADSMWINITYFYKLSQQHSNHSFIDLRYLYAYTETKFAYPRIRYNITYCTCIMSN